jgi:hypothetical protein
MLSGIALLNGQKVSLSAPVGLTVTGFCLITGTCVLGCDILGSTMKHIFQTK